MITYDLLDQEGFSLYGYTSPLRSDYNDISGLNSEKEAFFEELKGNGKLDELKERADNKGFYFVNHTKDYQILFSIAVKTQDKQDLDEIELLDSMYLVAFQTEDNDDQVLNTLTNYTFDTILPHLDDYIYKGGPNFACLKETENTEYQAEFWVPVSLMINR